MLRTTFLGVIFSINLICNAQITAPFVIENYHELSDNNNISLKEKNKTLFQEVLLKGFIQQADNQFCYPKYENFSQTNEYELAWDSLLNKFRLVDLDDDGDLDLIFAGKMCENQEKSYIMVFMCNFKNYTLAMFTEGKPVLINDKNELICLTQAQNETLENTLKVFKFKENRVEEKFEVTLFDSPLLHNSKQYANLCKNIVPKNLDIIHECEIPSGTTTYLTPNDSIPSSELIEKSTIHTLQKPQKVTVFNTLKDKKQQKWNYVAYQEESNPNSFVLGWIKEHNCQ